MRITNSTSYRVQECNVIQLVGSPKAFFWTTLDSGQFDGIEATRVWLGSSVYILVGGGDKENVEVASAKAAAGCIRGVIGQMHSKDDVPRDWIDAIHHSRAFSFPPGGVP